MKQNSIQKFSHFYLIDILIVYWLHMHVIAIICFCTDTSLFWHWCQRHQTQLESDVSTSLSKPLSSTSCAISHPSFNWNYSEPSLIRLSQHFSITWTVFVIYFKFQLKLHIVFAFLIYVLTVKSTHAVSFNWNFWMHCMEQILNIWILEKRMSKTILWQSITHSL